MLGLWTVSKRTLLAAVLAWLAVAPVWAAAAGKPEIPAPQGFVNDFAGVLSAGDRQKLSGLSATLQNATGAEMVFLIVPKTEPVDDFTYGMAVFDAWHIGQKGKDNGLLLLLAMQERSIRIVTGYGLEPILPDGKLGRYRDAYLVPRLRQGQVGLGLYDIGLVMAQDIAKAEGVELAGVPVLRPRREDTSNPWVTVIILMVFIALSIAIGRLNRRRGVHQAGPYIGGGFGGWSGRGGGGFGGGFGGFGGGFSGGGGVGGRW